MIRLLATLTFLALLLPCTGQAQSATDSPQASESPAPPDIERTLGGPNLTFYKPVGWSDVIVISNVPGTTWDATTISTDQPVYIDFAALNNGTATAYSFYCRLYVDGIQLYSGYTSLNAGYYLPFNDINIGKLGPGVHTFTMALDPTNAVAEVNEYDNTYTRTFTITAGSGFITTQVLYHGTSLYVGAVVQIYDESGNFVTTMGYQSSGDPYPGYWRGIVPDISKNYVLRCLLPSDSVYSRTQWNLGDPEPTYIQGNTYKVYGSDFRPSWTFNGVSREAYPRQFCYGRIPGTYVGSLNITLYQELSWGLAGPSARVELYNSSGYLVGQKRANANSIVQFDSLPAGTYSYKVYNNRNTLWGEQYWGRKSVAVSGTGITYDTHMHNTPFMPAMRVYNNSTGQLLTNGSRTSVPAGTHLRVEIDVTNPGYSGAENNTVVVTQIKLDRNTELPYDRSFSSTPFTLNRGQSVTTIIYLLGPSLITDNGAYSISCGCYVSGGPYGSNSMLSDAGGWIDPAFNIILGTASLPDTTTLVSPLNGASLQPPVRFSWRKVEGATKYWLSYSMDNWVSTVIDSTVTDTFKVVSALPGSAMVKWNVATGNSSGWNTGNWKSYRWFTTPLSAPQLQSPASGALNIPLSAVLKWRAVPGASAYRFQVAADSGFVGTIYENATGSDTFAIVPTLSENLTYYWRVRSETASMQSSYSPTWHFHTTLGAPLLLRPADQANGLSIPVMLAWRPLAGSVAYQLQVCPSSGFDSGLTLDDSTLVDTIRVISSLHYATQYFWRIRGRNGGSLSPWSQMWQFKTLEADPAIPKLLAPSPMTANLDTPVTVRWTRPPGSTSFHLQISSDSAFTSGILQTDIPTVDTFAVLHSLSFLSTYWWRVNAYSPVSGVSAYSQPSRFSTGLPLPSAIVLLEPQQNSIVNADTLRLRWKASGPAVDRYWVEYSIDTTFIIKATDSLLTDTTTVLRGMAKNMDYYWRVRAHNLAGWGPYSSKAHFRRSTTGVDQLAQGMPGSYMLAQNYPNPFNPSTTIAFGIPERARVRLAVYNTLGEVVSELTHAEWDEGYHSVTFSAAHLPSGVYFYRMDAGSFVMTRRLLLLR